MSKEVKKNKKDIDSLTYLKRVKGLGIFGIIFSIFLVGYDIYMFDNWVSILSIVVDGLLFAFSVYFIVKSNNLKKRELIAIEKKKEKKSDKEKTVTNKKNNKKGKK